MSARRVLALLATLTPAGCDYIAPPDPLALDPGVVSVAIVLVAGDTRARLLAGHPHRPVSDPPPSITASLVGPGWRAAFAHKTDPKAGCGGGPTSWPMPMVCLNAALPEPIREKAAYRLEGEGPKGSFAGEAVVPATPRILEPAGDTLWLPDTIRWIRIPIRYRAGPEVGSLHPQVLATFRTRTGTESEWLSVESLDPAGQADTLEFQESFEQASLHLLGIGWNYTRFYAFPGTSPRKRGAFGAARAYIDGGECNQTEGRVRWAIPTASCSRGFWTAATTAWIEWYCARTSSSDSERRGFECGGGAGRDRTRG